MRQLYQPRQISGEPSVCMCKASSKTRRKLRMLSIRSTLSKKRCWGRRCLSFTIQMANSLRLRIKMIQSYTYNLIVNGYFRVQAQALDVKGFIKTRLLHKPIGSFCLNIKDMPINIEICFISLVNTIVISKLKNLKYMEYNDFL